MHILSVSLGIRVNNCVGENNQKYFVLFTVNHKKKTALEDS